VKVSKDNRTTWPQSYGGPKQSGLSRSAKRMRQLTPALINLNTPKSTCQNNLEKITDMQLSPYPHALITLSTHLSKGTRIHRM
jgi:hypothetical protein